MSNSNDRTNLLSSHMTGTMAPYSKNASTSRLNPGEMTKPPTGYRQSLSQLGSRLKDFARKCKVPQNFVKKPQWWDSYQTILQSQSSQKRKISFPEEQHPVFKISGPVSKSHTNLATTHHDISKQREQFEKKAQENKEIERKIKNAQKETEQLTEFTIALKTLGISKVWKQFSYPLNINDIENSKNEETYTFKRDEKRKPMFINSLMSEREQMVVLKLWIEKMMGEVSPTDTHIDQIKSYNLIISFALSELMREFKPKLNEKAEIMLQIYDMQEKIRNSVKHILERDKTKELTVQVKNLKQEKLQMVNEIDYLLELDQYRLKRQD